MKSEEELEAWYDIEKQKILDHYLASLEKKEKIDEAEARYTKALQALFTQYKAHKTTIIAASIKDAHALSAKKSKAVQNQAKPESGLARIAKRLKIGALASLLKK